MAAKPRLTDGGCHATRLCLLALLLVGSAQADASPGWHHIPREIAAPDRAAFRPETVQASPDSRQVGYVVQGERGQTLYKNTTPLGTYPLVVFESIRFSPNSAWLTALARDTGGMVVVMDNRKSDAFDDVGRPGPVFSRDSRHIAFAVREGESTRVVWNGRRGEPMDAIDVTSLSFSPDGSRFAYAGRAGAHAYLVLDGVRQPPHDAILNNGHVVQWSEDSRRYAYFARTGDRCFAVLDGERQTLPFERTLVNGSAFSPDGMRFAYIAYDKGQFVMVHNGTRGTPFDRMAAPTFSPDSQRFAFAAGIEKHVAPDPFAPPRPEDFNEEFILLDGKKLPSYHGIDVSVMGFSPDSQRFAYGAGFLARRFLVVDEERGPVYSRLGAGSLRFSPDSRHIAHTARLDAGWTVVVDRTPGTVYPGLVHESLAFSPDSQHLAYVAMHESTEGGEKRRGMRVVIGVEEGEVWERIFLPPDGRLVWSDARTLEYIALRDSRLYHVRATLADGAE